MCFNPLRFGAGALPQSLRNGRTHYTSVSIPFVSGREHSPGSWVVLGMGLVVGFNPLRFGAGALP